ncbi:hypothetical protein AAES_11014 [Amazona aestiva]|uniref:Uncharacterized protein n=1 Tax=Amazona aestiva TaxID=12930 RepID=A0A0Q3X8S7_AMAAE|nr:hypothetical protein AAES_11014 [Amazona aestiva]
MAIICGKEASAQTGEKRTGAAKQTNYVANSCSCLLLQLLPGCGEKRQESRSLAGGAPHLSGAERSRAARSAAPAGGGDGWCRPAARLPGPRRARAALPRRRGGREDGAGAVRHHPLLHARRRPRGCCLRHGA